jgi:hypothetical protein
MDTAISLTSAYPLGPVRENEVHRKMLEGTAGFRPASAISPSIVSIVVMDDLTTADYPFSCTCLRCLRRARRSQSRSKPRHEPAKCVQSMMGRTFVPEALTSSTATG